MCFAPQRRALFRHLNFQKWSRTVCFDFEFVLRATTACTFSTSQIPKVVQMSVFFGFFTCKCASHHNGVHFFDIASLNEFQNWGVFVHFDLEMCFAHNGVQFSSLIWPAGTAPALASLLFRPSGATNHWNKLFENTVFATFLPFSAPGSSFFWDFLFFDLLSSSLLFSDSSHLCFHLSICRKFGF